MLLRADRTIAADTLLPAAGQAALRRQELYTGLFTESRQGGTDVRKALQEFRRESGRLFNKSSTVHTETQSRLSREKRQGASDEAIVVLILYENRE